MKNIKRRFLSIAALGTLSLFVFSCAGGDSASQSYYKKERKKYEIMDMHSDCPQLVNSRR
ncbi:hypothetical protein [Flammeovirga kamogawensis]|uniref:hypothetical protein n=1 Tax=Flammeovirga kamogawensis TaxID=373891 RepID=UPI00118460E2|nr:hypothetical protein [Flammeovirga kamogawensis]